MTDFAELRDVIKTVILPGDDGYEDSIKRWSAATEKRAAVVVMATTAEEVSAAIKFAVSTGTELTVAGGRHSSSGTSSTSGMIIDLCKMRKITVNQDSMTVTFGGGCIWEDVDKALDPFGLATVGGIVNHTGVGGLILGGGHGYLTAKHGLTIDNLVSAQFVTADGTILDVSDEKNPDLFWAIRGAGAQFGVATYFTSRVHPQGPVWSGALIFPAEKLPAITQAANVFLMKNNRDGHCLTLAIGYGPDGMQPNLTAMPLYHGSEMDGREYFSALLDAGPIADMTKMMNMVKVNALINHVSDHGIRRLMGSGNAVIPLDVGALQRTADKFWNFCDKHPGMGSKSVFAIEMWPTHRIRAVALDAMAYANRGDYFDAITILGWDVPEWDNDVREFNRSLLKQVRETLGFRKNADREQDKGKTGAPVGRYINLEADPVRPEEAYGVNLTRLRELKRKYDPEDVFHKWHGMNLVVD